MPLIQPWVQIATRWWNRMEIGPDGTRKIGDQNRWTGGVLWRQWRHIDIHWHGFRRNTHGGFWLSLPTHYSPSLAEGWLHVLYLRFQWVQFQSYRIARVEFQCIPRFPTVWIPSHSCAFSSELVSPQCFTRISVPLLFLFPLSCMIFQHLRQQTASGKCNDSTAAYLQGSRATPQVASIPITPQGHRFLVVRCMSDVIRYHSMWPWVELPVEIGFSFFFRTSPWRKAMRNTKSETFSWDSSGNLRWIWTEVGTWPSWAPTKTTLWSIAKLWMTCRPWRWTKATAAWF